MIDFMRSIPEESFFSILLTVISLNNIFYLKKYGYGILLRHKIQAIFAKGTLIFAAAFLVVHFMLSILTR
jgi:hypothetical protein